MYSALIAVMLGGALGSSARWAVGLKLNALFPHLPLGTLAVNLAGGFIVGAAMAYFVKSPHADPMMRVFIMTGVCGGFTTFSAFSLETVTLLQTGRPGWALMAVGAHVIGSLAFTFAGFQVVQRFV